ncbi:CAS1 appressorium specific protein [Metarhizium guizhouense ARSEF 977]|uniref:CAS1 appressorium specific protein n=1 Tax=Metarhizium guizhouense (strain ARSEF 977) TaxID=1276136 RepID=A0A0B4HQE5_METGA|nr:CAS1 appressorium specific protein [Metarhizium guizhouense ARSEF 977]
MHSSTIYVALAAFTSTLVEAHGKISVATGDAGGNTTALGIMGGVVPGQGPNRQTEPDTTIFRSRNAASDGLGRTKGNGANTLEGMSRVVAMSGSTLPQVSSNGGYISATYHIVTTDGAGPVRAIIDPSGTGQFSQGTEAEVMTQVPGRNGNIAPGPKSNNRPQNGQGGGGGGLIGKLLGKRASNVDTDHPLKVAIPAGTTCQGSMGGMSNVCLLKVANPSGAGPFGGVIAFQMAGSGANSTATGGEIAGGSGNASNSNGGNADIGNSNNSNNGAANNGENASSDNGIASTNEAKKGNSFSSKGNNREKRAVMFQS